MSENELFPGRPDIEPMIYAYEEKNPRYAGMLKVGYASAGVERRVAAQFPVLKPGEGKPYRIVFSGSAMYPTGGSFKDHAVHAMLSRMGFCRLKANGKKTEWFSCTVADVRAAWLAVRMREDNVELRSADFGMRPEQRAAVKKTLAYFAAEEKDRRARNPPRFLWNAKMRFGKTFAAYELAKAMGAKCVLVLTFKPAVRTAWREDLVTHVDFEGWQFISRPQDASLPSADEQYAKADKSRPIVCFGSFQDFLGYNRDTGGIKPANEWVHTIVWDLVVFDEYHFGAWRDSAKRLFETDEEDVEGDLGDSVSDRLDESWLPITARRYLYLSGTPFRAIGSGEFIEDQVFNWTYSDEQKAKTEWRGKGNPYATMPQMVMLTYRLPDSIRRIAEAGEFDEFSLNEFFAAKGRGKEARFVHEDYVQKWLDLIRGSHAESASDELKLGRGRPAMPFADTRLLGILSHTLWFLPDVASCHAMANLLAERQNAFYHGYNVVVCAGAAAGTGAAALEPVEEAMDDPLKTRTITLSCGKLTTGVTVRPWSGVFMLRNLKSPETYFQTAFRAQSPWTAEAENGEVENLKGVCYVVDFALDRALRQVADYACRLTVEERNPEKKVGDFIKFLPVIAYDGSSMKRIDAGEILDIAMSGTSATLLARRWESALLVNVDNETLRRLMANEKAMEALMRIEAFRALRSDIETVINKSERVKAAKSRDEALTKKERAELTAEEKEFKSKRREIQEKLVKFATRIPVFMYLTDFREYCLEDVITQFEPRLFKKVTGLEVEDFNLLCSLNVFNAPLMNDAVYKFKRYEDASLGYTGLESRHAGEATGLYDTVLSPEDYERLRRQQTDSLAS